MTTKTTLHLHNIITQLIIQIVLSALSLVKNHNPKYM